MRALRVAFIIEWDKPSLFVHAICYLHCPCKYPKIWHFTTSAETHCRTSSWRTFPWGLLGLTIIGLTSMTIILLLWQETRYLQTTEYSCTESLLSCCTECSVLVFSSLGSGPMIDHDGLLSLWDLKETWIRVYVNKHRLPRTH